MAITSGALRVGILAILAGLIGAVVVQQVLTSKPAAPVAAAPNQTVPIASADLPEGRVVSMGDIALVEMTPEDLRRRGTSQSLVMVDPLQIIGRRLKNSISARAFFTTPDFYLENSAPEIELKPGFRAYTMQLSPARAVGLSKGQLVDVLFRSENRPARDGQLAIPEMTVMLLQAVEVAQIEEPPPVRPNTTQGPPTLDLRQRGPRTPPPISVTLAVKPDEAKRLQAVAGRGELMLSPRAPTDKVATPEAATAGTTLEDILGIEPVAVVQRPMPFITEAYRRGNLDMRGYARDAIQRYQPRAATRPVSLPIPAMPAVDYTPTDSAPKMPNGDVKSNGNGGKK
jgi:Flp pilus assembly protein CpaB